MKIGVLVSGGGTNLQAIIDAIESGELENCSIATVVSSKPGVYALERALIHGIPAAVISRKDFVNLEEFDAAICGHMERANVDLIVMAGFLSIVGDKLLSKFAGRIINIHPSLLPKFGGKGFYGLKVHEEVIRSGEKTTGATVHFVNEGVDEGKIILQKEIEVRSDDTPQSLQQRVMEECEWEILVEAIKRIGK
ncbi:MAG: phosphoribosylglycinamide formyltransferase [Oscillospiraceae bacterium]|nr:phosphoribosylglycinamide formyltransferase [Oscillospiraceae bacterium]